MTEGSAVRCFYDLVAMDLDGRVVSMADYQGYLVLITNTSSSGAGRKHLGRLEALYETYKDNGFVVLAFPCPQYGEDGSLSNEALKEIYYHNNQVSYKVFAPANVNGNNTHQIFEWLKSKKSGHFGARIEWSFAKFLVSRDGQKVMRFSSWSKYDEIGQQIRFMIAEYGTTAPNLLESENKNAEVHQNDSLEEIIV